MEADRRDSATALALILAGTEAIGTTKWRVADSAGPFLFAPKLVSAAPPTRQVRSGSAGDRFGLNGKKGAPGTRLDRFFGTALKNGLGACRGRGWRCSKMVEYLT